MLSTSFHDMMESEIPISGGRLNRGRLVRLRDFVLRPSDEDPFMEQLIIEVGKVFTGIAKMFGRDPDTPSNLNGLKENLLLSHQRGAKVANGKSSVVLYTD